jgi:hypothetical protein
VESDAELSREHGAVATLVRPDDRGTDADPALDQAEAEEVRGAAPDEEDPNPGPERPGVQGESGNRTDPEAEPSRPIDVSDVPPPLPPDFGFGPRPVLPPDPWDEDAGRPSGAVNDVAPHPGPDLLTAVPLAVQARFDLALDPPDPPGGDGPPVPPPAPPPPTPTAAGAPGQAPQTLAGGSGGWDRPPPPPPTGGTGGGSHADRGSGAALRRYLLLALIVGLFLLVAAVVPSARTSTGTGAGSTGTTVAAGVTPAPVPGSPGRTVSGVACGPGVRQVAWSRYAPVCVPAWHGDNGGATAPGVTRTTITLTYRGAASSELQAIYSIVPKSVLGTNPEAVATMQAYVNTFNRTFELYGRHVVLKAYTGQGDFVNELNGSGQSQAQQDAVTAKSLGAFADSSAIDATPIYEQALSNQHIVGLSIYGGPDSQYRANAPYQYTSAAVCSKGNAQLEQLVSRVLAKTPVDFAGPGLNGRRRVFGLVQPATADTQQCDAQAEAALRRMGVPVATTSSLGLNGNLSAEATSAVAGMKAAGVTTVLCSSCDFFTPVYLTKAADAEGFHPEWVESDFLDALTALQVPDQLAHAIAFGEPAPVPSNNEALTAFRLGAPRGATPIPPYSFLYAPLLEFFSALQQAGPDLTPTRFEQAFQSVARSRPGGQFGGWVYRPGGYDPNATYAILRWSGSARAAVGGTPGAWLPCNGGAQYALSGAPPRLPAGQPLDCPG